MELELKFCVPEAALPSLRAALLAHGARRVRLRAHYFDTPCGALARHRVALRMRLEGRHWVQTLKAPGAGAVHRLEHEVRVPGKPGARPALDPRLHAGHPAALALAVALASAAEPTLVEQFATDVWRLHAEFTDEAGTRTEAALDVGHALADGCSAPITELELEHKGGPLPGLFDLAAACVRHGALWQSTVTKAERGLRLRDPGDGPRVKKEAPPPLPAHPDGATLLRALLQATLTQVLANASEMQPAADTLAVAHALRAALRRLRGVLRALAPLSPAVAPHWDAALARPFAALGAQRDRLAVPAAVLPLLQAAGAPPCAWPGQAAPAEATVAVPVVPTPTPTLADQATADAAVAVGAEDPVAAVRASDFQVALVQMQALAHAGDEAFAAVSAPAARRLVAQRLQALHRQVLREGESFETLPPERQHRLRKRLKRLRDLAALAAGLWPQRAARRDARRLATGVARALDALGQHQDVQVAAAAWRAQARQQPEAAFAAGWLQAHQAVTARAARRALRPLARLPVFWS